MSHESYEYLYHGHFEVDTAIDQLLLKDPNEYFFQEKVLHNKIYDQLKKNMLS